MEVSRRNISGSLFPMDGKGLHLSMYDGWEERIRSNVLIFCVGKSTSCSMLSAVMSRMAWLTLSGYWFPSLVLSFQQMLGSLTSPPTKIPYFDFSGMIFLSLLSTCKHHLFCFGAYSKNPQLEMYSCHGTAN